MAIANLLTLIDDIATVLDDVSVMTKVAAKKTAGVLGDDLALNAQQVTGVAADRELPVVWAVARGSAINKVILVPAAVAISAFLPWLVTPLLMLGGAFLCFEGVEKVVHKLVHRGEDAAEPILDETEKIRGAVRTDFILSAEIIVISLGTVAAQTIPMQFAVLAAISLVMTVGVYGLVAGIVKLDDLGLHLHATPADAPGSAARRRTGALILAAAPRLMKALGIAGTVAMFLVGGGIVAHGFHAIDDAIASIGATSAALPAVGPLAGALVPSLLQGLVGIVTGAIALALWLGVRRLIPARAN